MFPHTCGGPPAVLERSAQGHYILDLCQPPGTGMSLRRGWQPRVVRGMSSGALASVIVSTPNRAEALVATRATEPARSSKLAGPERPRSEKDGPEVLEWLPTPADLCRAGTEHFALVSDSNMKHVEHHHVAQTVHVSTRADTVRRDRWH